MHLILTINIHKYTEFDANMCQYTDNYVCPIEVTRLSV